MLIKIPQHHSFLPYLDISPVNATPEWEIGVSSRDDIAWSIVLSYLISADYKDAEDFERRLRTLTGSDENVKSVLKSIRSFNPFRNRFACFFDEILNQVIWRFKEIHNWNNLVSVSDKLSAASMFLNCPILLIKQTDANMETHVFKENANEPNEGKSQDIITLFASPVIDEELQNSGTLYTFMLNQKLGLKLKNSALSYFLRETGICKKNISQVMKLVENGEHFLISILKSGVQMVIHDIYKFPYIVTKITEAGFETDPKLTDAEQFSALYHALVTADSKLLYQLYFFAANSCFESKGTYRNPDCHVVNNLQEIEKILQNDLLKSNDFIDCKNRDEVRKSFDHLLRLNKFLTEITTKILKLREKVNYDKTVSDEEYEATKRRDIIISILNVYDNFFKTDTPENSNISPLEDYIKHKQYYYSIDITAAICFFDNIFYLKERLSLENNVFSDMEERFLFLVLFQVYFNKSPLEKIAEDLRLNMSSSNEHFYAFPLMQRQDITFKIKEFSQILQDTVISQGINLLKYIPEKEIYATLKSFPEIKDCIEIMRLKYYLNTAIKVKVINIKSVLVIERALQVLGEYMNSEPDNNFSVLRRIFPLCLPNNISRILRRIRNQLSHLKGHAFPSKFESEKNYPLFRYIQKEIRSIYMHFKPVFYIQTLRELLFGIKNFEESLKRIKNSTDLYSYEYKFPTLVKKKTFFNVKSHTKHFIRVFDIVLINLDEEIASEMLNISMDTKSLITYKLWPLQFLLEFSLIFPPIVTTYTTTLLEMFSLLERSNSHEDLRKNIDNCMRECKNISLIFQYLDKRRNIQSVDHCEIFLNVLKGFIYLSQDEKDEIRKEIPLSLKESVMKKERLVTSIYNGFSLNVEEHFTEFEISYLSNKKSKMLKDFYRNKNEKALDILKMTDPIAELEEMLSTNSINKKNYKLLCKTMKFSDTTREKLWNLVAGQRKKTVVNNLSILQNRIRLLKQILIEDNKEIAEQWIRIKSEKAQQHFVNKIVNLFLRDHELLASVEMLLLDCMVLFKNENSIENPWIKSSKLYGGINLRNVISHGNPLLESLCYLIDPDDLLTEMTCKVLRLIENEDTVDAILELYKCTNDDFAKLSEILNMTESYDYLELRCRIQERRKVWEFGRRNCQESCIRKDWKNFLLLIPYNSTA